MSTVNRFWKKTIEKVWPDAVDRTSRLQFFRQNPLQSVSCTVMLAIPLARTLTPFIFLRICSLLPGCKDPGYFLRSLTG